MYDISLDAWQAVFSFCLVLFTLGQVWYGHRQWVATEKQWDTMIELNRLTKDQVTEATKANDVSLRATEQTDKVIEQMRLERRAWLSVAPQLHSRPGEEIRRCFLRVHNSGKNPATVRQVLTTYLTGSHPVNFSACVEQHRTHSTWQLRESPVAPNATLELHMNAVEIEPAKLGDKSIAHVILATVVYSDFAGGRKTQCVFTYDATQQKLIQHDEYNYMC